MTARTRTVEQTVVHFDGTVRGLFEALDDVHLGAHVVSVERFQPRTFSDPVQGFEIHLEREVAS